MAKDSEIKTLGETENYAIWVSQDPESGDTLYHVEIGNITLHFFEDEWEEFVELMMQSVR